MVKPVKCKDCGNEDIKTRIQKDGQYTYAYCPKCGREGSPGYYFSGLTDDMTDDEIAIENWNNESV